MAQALLQGTIGGFRRAETDQDVPGLFPPELIVQVKALACELPATWACRFPAGVWPMSRGSAAAGWWHVSATRRCGAGCMKMPFIRGDIAAGFSPVIQTSWPRPGGCWISIRVSGRTNHCATTSSSFRRMRRPVSRLVFASIQSANPVPRSDEGRARIRAGEPGPTWRRWTFIGPKSLVVAKRPPVSFPLTDWSIKS